MGRAQTVCSMPGCPELVEDRGRCPAHRRAGEAKRPNAGAQGYGARWRRVRACFLRTHPLCQWPDCWAKATDVDHVTLRTELVRQGVADPDAEQYLQALCHSHHSQKTARETGGWAKARRADG